MNKLASSESGDRYGSRWVPALRWTQVYDRKPDHPLRKCRRSAQTLRVCNARHRQVLGKRIEFLDSAIE